MGSNKDGQRTGVWTKLPSTISQQAKMAAEMIRNYPMPASAQNPAAWRAANEAAIAQFQSPIVQQILNIRPTKIESVTIAGAEHFLFSPKNPEAPKSDFLIVHMHGGAYVSGMPQHEGGMASPLVESLGCSVLSVRYPLWWEEPAGADVERVVSVYRELLLNRTADSIALMGGSAGGGLAFRVTLKLKALGLPLPAALVLATPWLDVSCSGDTVGTIAPYDLIDETIVETAKTLLGSDAALHNPEFSPIYADVPKDFPPTIIAVGTRDMLLSDAARLQRKLAEAGVVHDLRVFEGMFHGFMGFRLPEADACMGDFSRFLTAHLLKGNRGSVRSPA